MLHEKSLEAVDQVFDELTAQYHYLKGQTPIDDVRLLNYVQFTKEIIRGFYTKQITKKAEVETILKMLHFNIWEDIIFDKNNYCGYDDNSWILLRLEKHLLSSNAIYEQFWNDGAIKARNAHQVLQLRTVLFEQETPLRQDAIWEIKGEAYVVGTAFALNTDLWLRSVEGIDQPTIQYSYRLSDLMPLKITDLKLLKETEDKKMQQ